MDVQLSGNASPSRPFTNTTFSSSAEESAYLLKGMKFRSANSTVGEVITNDCSSIFLNFAIVKR
jgi:hypothetical protein